jgi:hypothetical protein
MDGSMSHFREPRPAKQGEEFATTRQAHIDACTSKSVGDAAYRGK